ncbi:hypothetical protein [uncultured Bifidobacterium sp.]|uniref:hypothetical protein n=1 Tax=uncultured Bifidobacterium sp. TaxID=165187 RepID=UPI0025D3651D|nr:hypothetical protein [uncultured Bifidobacterium sp.]
MMPAVGKKGENLRASAISCAMNINWDACSAIATAVATAVALFLAVYNIRQGVINEHKAIVDKAFGIALRLVDVAGDFYMPNNNFSPSLVAIKGRYLIRLLNIYGYSCDEDKVFNYDLEESFKELDRLFEQIKYKQ